jgi:4-diphosphocytidyl-2C-methyl-D-erythritol kinase
VLTALPEEAITVVLVTPALAVASAAVYAAFDEIGESHGTSVSNHLEPAAIAVEPRLARWRDFLREIGERTPVLAGSGSSYFFECGEHEAQQIESAVRRAIDEVHARAQVRLCRSVPAGSI